jgi:hypothetical protein
MTHDTIRCDRLDELLPDYLEGTLDAGTRTVVEAHLAQCERCASIVADVNAILKVAGHLPDLTPTKDLWAGISERIAAPVISLPSERERRSVRFARLRMVAGAAALVAITATLTFVGTKAVYQTKEMASPPQIGSGDTPPPSIIGSQIPIQPGPGKGADTATVETPAPVSTPVAGQGPSRTQLATPPRSTRLPGASNVARTGAERAYDREIDQLQALLKERRGELDQNTVQVIERNLQVIDDAIRQSREALQRDPASRFLNDQLNNALDRKIELLRSAAMLPSST